MTEPGQAPDISIHKTSRSDTGQQKTEDINIVEDYQAVETRLAHIPETNKTGFLVSSSSSQYSKNTVDVSGRTIITFSSPAFLNDAITSQSVHGNQSAISASRLVNKEAVMSANLEQAVGDQAQKAPLTEKSLNLLHSMPNETVDSDTETISDQMGTVWSDQRPIASHFFAASRLNKYIELIDGSIKAPRKAYVEAYFKSEQVHMITFCETPRVSTFTRLTDNNHRILNATEIEMLSDNTSQSEHSSQNFSQNGFSAKANNETNADRPQHVKKIHMMRTATGRELIGTCIRVRSKSNTRICSALVVGCQDRLRHRQMYKVFYTSKQKTEEIDLSKRHWTMQDQGSRLHSLVGKRLVIYKLSCIYEAIMRDLRLPVDICYQGLNKVPFEAFVIDLIEPFKYKLLYTASDNFEELDATNEETQWDILKPGLFEVNGISLVSWSTLKRRT